MRKHCWTEFSSSCGSPTRIRSDRPTNGFRLGNNSTIRFVDVAGSRASKEPGVRDFVKDVLSKALLRAYRRSRSPECKSQPAWLTQRLTMGRNNRDAVHDYPFDCLLRRVLLPGRRIRVWFRRATCSSKRGAVGGWEFGFGVWLAGQPSGSGGPVLCSDGLEHDASAEQIETQFRKATFLSSVSK